MHTLNNEALESMKNTKSQLEQKYGMKVKVPSKNTTNTYKAPNYFRLLFSIIHNGKVVKDIISDAILSVHKGKHTFEICRCGPHNISMTQVVEINAFFEYPNTDRVVASFSYNKSGREIEFPQSGISVTRVENKGGYFQTPLFPDPDVAGDIQVS